MFQRFRPRQSQLVPRLVPTVDLADLLDEE